MERFSKNARKYLTCLIGIGLLIGMRYLEIEIPGLPALVSDLIGGLLVAESVYQLPNTPPAPDAMDGIQ
jgi:hypothetical protein